MLLYKYKVIKYVMLLLFKKITVNLLLIIYLPNYKNNILVELIHFLTQKNKIYTRTPHYILMNIILKMYTFFKFDLSLKISMVLIVL